MIDTIILCHCMFACAQEKENMLKHKKMCILVNFDFFFLLFSFIFQKYYQSSWFLATFLTKISNWKNVTEKWKKYHIFFHVWSRKFLDIISFLMHGTCISKTFKHVRNTKKTRLLELSTLWLRPKAYFKSKIKIQML